MNILKTVMRTCALGLLIFSGVCVADAGFDLLQAANRGNIGDVQDILNEKSKKLSKKDLQKARLAASQELGNVTARASMGGMGDIKKYRDIVKAIDAVLATKK